MNEGDSSTFHEEDIEKLKQQLASFCKEKHISKFESEDIVELLADGESVDWIMEQLTSDASSLDVAAAKKLLTDIRLMVCPEKETAEVASEETPAEAGLESLNLSDIDFSQIDMSRLGDMLPKGMQLPAGMDIKQLQEMMDSPQGKFMADLTVFCQEQGVDMAAINDPKEIQELEAQWQKTPRPAFDGKTPAEILAEEPTLIAPKVETYRREEPRVGRNDPCPCGSGKKYKKCCGRGK